MPADAGCVVRFTRRSEYADMIRSYELLVNGVRVGSIARNGVLDVKRPSGALTIEARIDWCGSRPLRIDAASGQQIEIEVSNHWGALLGLWGITFGSKSYLVLRQKPST